MTGRIRHIITRQEAVLMVALLIVGVLSVSAKEIKEEDSEQMRTWQVSLGLERMAFYGSHESELNVSKSPFSSVRGNFGAAATIGKWITPVIGVRIKGSGYWGKDVYTEDPIKNSILYYNIQTQGMVNILNAVNGIKERRFYNVIPYAGFGFVRNCSFNSNSLGFSMGVNNTFRISNHISAHCDLEFGFAGKENSQHIKETGRFRYISGVAGLTFNLGKLKRRMLSETEKAFLSQTSYSASSFHNTMYSKSDALKRNPLYAALDVPENMVIINRGHIRMGIENPDSLWGSATPIRDISIDDFMMDKTEVTNAMYQEFIDDVVDSIVEARIRDPKYDDDIEKVIESLVVVNPITGEEQLDTRQINYVYSTYDYTGAALRQNRINPRERVLNTDIAVDENEVIMVSKDTAYIDAKGNIISETITRKLSGPYDFLNTYSVNIYPDTTVWVNDFPKSDNTMYMRYYFSHRNYADYPVVGVTWEQANAYCAWRTEKLRKQLGGSLGDEQPYRLPTEAEWEYAARGTTQNEFPWEQYISGENRQKLLANFQPAEGNYTQDGNIITSKVGIYPANRNGLYDMAGNVAEWTSTAYTDAGIEGMNNINPQHDYRAAYTDAYAKKKKSVRGGSWKDSESHIKSAWRSAEYQNQPRSYIGFRCVRSIATKPTERIVITK